MNIIVRCLYCLLFALFVSACTTKQYQLSEDRYVGPQDGAILKVPARLQVMSVNGEPVPELSNNILMADAEIVLPQGDHELKVRYRDTWDVGRDDFTKIVSDPLYLNLKATPRQAYQLTYNAPANLAAAERFAENPEFTIVKAGTAQVEPPSKEQRSMMNAKRSTQVSRVQQVEKDFSMEKQNQASSMEELKQADVVASSSTRSEQRRAYSNLKNWWDKATPQERADFQRWVWAEPGRQ